MTIINAYKELVRLLNNKKYFVGTVVSIDTVNQLSTISLISGETITAKGVSVGVSENCLIEDGFVKQQLPAMTSFSVTI